MAQGIVFCHGHTQELHPLFANSGIKWTLLDRVPEYRPDIVADATDPNIVPLLGAEQYDVVVMHRCTLVRFDDMIKMLRNAYALLKNGGTVYVMNGPGILIRIFAVEYNNIKNNIETDIKIVGPEGQLIVQIWSNTLNNTKYENMNRMMERWFAIENAYVNNTDPIITDLVNQTIEIVSQLAGFSTSGTVPQIPDTMAYSK